VLAAVTTVLLALGPAPSETGDEASAGTGAETDAPTDSDGPDDGDDDGDDPASPSTPSPGPASPSGGGFGEVGEVAVESDLRAPPPTKPTIEQAESKPRFELGARAEIGFAQTSVGNAAGLDHVGVFLRAHLVLFPWISKSRAIAAGLGGAYSYAGLNHKLDPALGFALARSKAQQQTITLSFDVLARPDLDWFAIHLSPMIGLGWYANAELLTADRPAEVANDEYGFAAGGSLALCTAWAIACVTGGSQILLGIRSTALELDGVGPEPRVVNPWGWQLALGVDLARIVMRARRVPQ